MWLGRGSAAGGGVRGSGRGRHRRRSSACTDARSRCVTLNPGCAVIRARVAFEVWLEPLSMIRWMRRPGAIDWPGISRKLMKVTESLRRIRLAMISPTATFIAAMTETVPCRLHGDIRRRVPQRDRRRQGGTPEGMPVPSKRVKGITGGTVGHHASLTHPDCRKSPSAGAGRSATWTPGPARATTATKESRSAASSTSATTKTGASRSTTPPPRATPTRSCTPGTTPGSPRVQDF